MKSPSILTLQEKKFQVAGRHNIDGYFFYEHLRSEKTAGGEIFMAVVKELNPSLVMDGGDDVEALTVDINYHYFKRSSLEYTHNYYTHP